MSATNSDAFLWNPTLLRTLFLALGYDVEFDNAWPGDESGTITGRRERANRAHLIVVDAGGRFGARVTVTAGDRGREDAIEGIPVRVTETTQKISIVSGQLAHAGDLELVLRGLDDVATPGEPAVDPSWTDLPPPP